MSFRLKTFSPVLLREMIAISRQKKYFALRGVFVSCLLLAMVYAWRKNVQSNCEDLSALGLASFQAFMAIQYILILLFVPGLSASLIAAEKERNTLSLLLISNLAPHNIILDKLVSRLILLVLYLMAGVPLFICLLFFRGVEPQQIALAYMSVFSCIVFCTAIGVFCSTFLHRLVSAVSLSYLIILGLGAFVLWQARGNEPLSLMHLALFPPASVLPKEFALFEVKKVSSPYAVCLTGLFLASAHFVLQINIAVFLLRHFNTANRINLAAKFNDWLNELFSGEDLMGKVIIKDVELKSNPVVWREAHKRLFSSPTVQIRLFYILSITLGLLCCAMFVISQTALQFMEGVRWLTGAYVILVQIVVALLAARTFTRERENSTLETLCITTLGGRKIIWGKFYGVMKSIAVLAVVPPTIVVIAHRLITGIPFDWLLLSKVGVYMGLIPLYVVSGMMISLRHRQSILAIVHTAIVHLLILGLYGYVFVLGGLPSDTSAASVLLILLGLVVGTGLLYTLLTVRFEHSSLREFKS